MTTTVKATKPAKLQPKTHLCDVLNFLPKATRVEKAVLLDALTTYAQTGKINLRFNDVPLVNVLGFIATSSPAEFNQIKKTVEERRAL